MTESHRHWSVTINNPTKDDEAVVDTAPNTHSWVKEIVGQKEVGENGTEHYQLYVRTDKVRFTKVKSLFPRGHIEPARNPTALIAYVQKDETAVAGTRKKVKQALPTDIYTYILRAYVHPTGYYKTVNYPKEFNTLEDVAYAHQCWMEYERDFEYYGDSFPLRLLKAASNEMVQDGWFVEHIASNPMFKQAFKEHLHSIMYRQHGLLSTQQSAQTIEEVGTQGSPDA